MVTGDKWLKARAYNQQLHDTASTTNSFNFKELESIRGYLTYIIRTYPAFTPYLKGVHLTLDSWQPGRSGDGWKDVGEFEELSDSILHGHPPVLVTGVPRLQQDLRALSTLFNPLVPPRQVARSNEVMLVWYGFGDASRTGFGSSFITPTGTKVWTGLWGRDLSHQSSNFRELWNLSDALIYELEDRFPVLQEAVHQVVSLVQVEQLAGLEVFLFTDNMVAECAFYRGTSSNPLLFDLILKLKQVELTHSLHLHVVHITGTRMMAQGTNGLSRGAPSYGIDTRVGVPLHLSPLQRDSGLLGWLQAWIPSLCVLEPYGWFTLGHGIAAFEPNSDGIPTPITVEDHSVFLWHPAPAAAEAALEELCLAHHKHPHLRHVFICPRLFTHTWRKRLFKFVDLTFNLSPGFILGVWPASQHEPLVIGICSLSYHIIRGCGGTLLVWANFDNSCVKFLLLVPWI
jgi:hypothetical protein